MSTYNKMYKTTHNELKETMCYKSKTNLYSFKILRAKVCLKGVFSQTQISFDIEKKTH